MAHNITERDTVISVRDAGWHGLAKVLEVVLQLRGAAGERQLDGVRVGLAQSWRGIPTTTGAVGVFSVDEAVA